MATEAEELTLSDLLKMVFSALLIRTSEKQIFITAERNRLHPFFFRLVTECGEDFPVLRIPLTTGETYPYSHNLIKILRELQEEGACIYLGRSYLIELSEDTVEHHLRDLERHFERDSVRRKRFDELVDRFEAVVEN